MDAFGAALNDLLVTTFRTILHLEEEMLNRISRDQLSINELHMLEAVAKRNEGDMTITDIARELSITPPSVTAAVNKLDKKGYLTKEKSEADKRIVLVRMTPKGRRTETAHRFFHRQMVNAVAKKLPKDQREALLNGLNNLNAFFAEQEALLEQMITQKNEEFSTEKENKS